MRVSTDIGGTFTDLAAITNDGKVLFGKTHTTPPNLEQGILNVMVSCGVNFAEIDVFIHGTTAIINALTERKGAKTALLTTAGFRDVLEIARCNRPDLFNIGFAKPVPFVPRHLRLEVSERMDYKGRELTPVNKDDIDKALKHFRQEGVQAIAVCFLHSYANPAHEIETVEYVKSVWPDVYVTNSSTITKEWREYERTSTAVLNAYVMPAASKYIALLEEKLSDAGLRGKKFIMQSNGGATTFQQAKETPINMVESGPVAGVFGAALLGKMLGISNTIALDVGGTTAKCSLVAGNHVNIITDYKIERSDRNAGYPIMAPVVDIVEIGNGGGSIAWIDETGGLKVGPKSAGSVPGPVAYGRGGVYPTTTDACLLTGRLSAKNFDNEVNLNNVRDAVIDHIGKPLSFDWDKAAFSIIRVAESNMLNALKLISVRKGHDPRDFTMVAFGGGGPMHCAALAAQLGIRSVVVPNAAAVFSAWGMMMADLRHDYLKTSICRTLDVTLDFLNNEWRQLENDANTQLKSEGVDSSTIILQYSVDMRYMGQEHTVKINALPAPWNDQQRDEIISRFHEAHEKNFTFKLPQTPTEIVNFHLTAFGKTEKPEVKEISVPQTTLDQCIVEERDVYFEEKGFVKIPVYSREKIWPGIELQGPGIVQETSASTLFFSGQKLTVDKYGNLFISLEEQA
ncbi:MAG: hydantoinase/oxoprolinase family protein [Treponema sp.]|jgi:N-methylhydantoinase A|nr:hydantoinase/oxoprolinase family protein [Treponema sp.]